MPCLALFGLPGAPLHAETRPDVADPAVVEAPAAAVVEAPAPAVPDDVSPEGAAEIVAVLRAGVEALSVALAERRAAGVAAAVEAMQVAVEDVPPVRDPLVTTRDRDAIDTVRRALAPLVEALAGSAGDPSTDDERPGDEEAPADGAAGPDAAEPGPDAAGTAPDEALLALAAEALAAVPAWLRSNPDPASAGKGEGPDAGTAADGDAAD